MFTGRMPFLPPNQQRQRTEARVYCVWWSTWAHTGHRSWWSSRGRSGHWTCRPRWSCRSIVEMKHVSWSPTTARTATVATDTRHGSSMPPPAAPRTVSHSSSYFCVTIRYDISTCARKPTCSLLLHESHVEWLNQMLQKCLQFSPLSPTHRKWPKLLSGAAYRFTATGTVLLVYYFFLFCNVIEFPIFSFHF